MKKIVAVLLSLALLLGVTAAVAEETKTLPIIATANPHYEILQLIQDDLAALGYQLELGEPCDNYIAENPSTAAGDTLANFFQHIPYLAQYNASVAEDQQLVAVVPTHFEPMGIYPGLKSSLDELAEGDVIYVPNDPVNMTRAFILLADAGLVELPEGTTLESVVTKFDVGNPKGLVFEDVAAEQTPRLRNGGAFAVINGNYASQNQLIPGKDAVYFEQAGSQAAEAYVNVFAVKPENAEADFVKALEKTVYTQKVFDLIVNSGFAPVFEVPAE